MQSSLFQYDRCIRLLLALLATGVVPALPAALAGVPERPIPGRDWPRLWLATYNDDLGGNPLVTHDDYRTAAFNAGVTVGRTVGFVDYSILTVREEGLRTDELTLSLGYRLLDHRDLPGREDLSFDLSAGVGYRRIGDLGGQDLQNRWHRLLDVPERDLVYEEADDEGLAWLNAQLAWHQPLAADWRWGVSAALRGLITSDGAVKVSPTVSLLLQRRDFDLWLGVRVEGRTGDASTRTKHVVREIEDGTWITWGIRPLRHVYLTGGANTGSDGMYGALGLVWPAPESGGFDTSP